MTPTHLTIFSLWTNQKAASAAIRCGDRSTAGDAIKTISQIERLARKPGIRAASAAAVRDLSRGLAAA